MIYNQIVVASNDNESSQVTLPGFSISVPVPVIRGLTCFLTMAEVEDGVVIIDCVIITSAEREVKDSRRSGMYQSCNFLTRLDKQSL